MSRHEVVRAQLDQLLALDATASFVFGMLSLLAPHGILSQFTGGAYNHNVHETLRLYGCLRVACGWILWHMRAVDDGRFRKHVCEALFVCYVLQALAVLRAQFTDTDTNDQPQRFLQWIVILVLLALSVAYGSFRFRRGGNLIKIYELPSSSSLR